VIVSSLRKEEGKLPCPDEGEEEEEDEEENKNETQRC
jgi:hypothetical protein